jgi:4'-phosphopantetheinyl transferase
VALTLPSKYGSQVQRQAETGTACDAKGISPLSVDDPMTAKERLAQSGRGVHVWPIRIPASDDGLTWLCSLLTGDERKRAARFTPTRLRRSFIITRGILRTLLGRYIDLAPAAVPLCYGINGKPSLAIPSQNHFNMSHSGDLAVFAFTTGCEVGVDVELMRPLLRSQDLAESFFSPDEVLQLHGLSVDQRERAFFLCWTRKEAYIKATGRGLAAPLHEFAVNLGLNEPPRLLHIGHDRLLAESWTIHNLDIDPAYAGALAYRDAPRPIVVFPTLYPVNLLEQQE